VEGECIQAVVLGMSKRVPRRVPRRVEMGGMKSIMGGGDVEMGIRAAGEAIRNRNGNGNGN
jgi:hypothetical protein